MTELQHQPHERPRPLERREALGGSRLRSLRIRGLQRAARIRAVRAPVDQGSEVEPRLRFVRSGGADGIRGAALLGIDGRLLLWKEVEPDAARAVEHLPELPRKRRTAVPLHALALVELYAHAAPLLILAPLLLRQLRPLCWLCHITRVSGRTAVSRRRTGRACLQRLGKGACDRLAQDGRTISQGVEVYFVGVGHSEVPEGLGESEDAAD
mmetsp:Transcript_55979/g.175627  ORF Transcript_55979/g.175627 Transcript_55979/m.175627 type:complete len:211 (+) Transcript_55979:2397-3029(+)